MNCTELIYFIFDFLAFFLAVISVCTVICTIKQNKAILQQNQLMIEEQTRPILAIYPVNDLSSKVGYIVIRNCGMSQAILKNIESDCNMEGKYYAENDIDYLKMACGSVIAPGRNIHCVIDTEKIEKPIVFTVEYDSSVGKTYKETTTVDFHSGIVMPDSTHDTLEKDVYKKIEFDLSVIKGIMEDKHHKDF